MIDRFFLDTNIFVYSVTASSPDKRRIAAGLIGRGIETGKGVISYQVVQEFFHIAPRRFAIAMSLAQCEEYLSTTFRPLLAIHSSQALFSEALQLNRRYSLSWYDSLILAAALEAECGVLYTEDLQHGQRFDKLRVLNPFL